MLKKLTVLALSAMITVPAFAATHAPVTQTPSSGSVAGFQAASQNAQNLVDAKNTVINAAVGARVEETRDRKGRLIGIKEYNDLDQLILVETYRATNGDTLTSKAYIYNADGTLSESRESRFSYNRFGFTRTQQVYVFRAGVVMGSKNWNLKKDRFATIRSLFAKTGIKYQEDFIARQGDGKNKLAARRLWDPVTGDFVMKAVYQYNSKRVLIAVDFYDENNVGIETLSPVEGRKKVAELTLANTKKARSIQ